MFFHGDGREAFLKEVETVSLPVKCHVIGRSSFIHSAGAKKCSAVNTSLGELMANW